ncbi:MAG TPA: SprT family zinc-dependent metalloprotease [Candidatus Saccharimonadales bacterium]
MPSKQFLLTGFGDITITKRNGNRNLRLSIKPDGSAVVTIPAWATYHSGLAFAQSKLDWLLQQVPEKTMLQDGQPIGKYHHLQLSPTRGLSSPKTLVTKTAVIVRYPIEWPADDQRVQTAAETACIRALRAQATQLLPQRLEQLAEQHGFHFNEVRIKQLKGRWGSCDQDQRIVLNLFLMQLPWECIDYVLLHELTHTKVLRHGPPFWEVMQGLIPNLAAIRRQMRTERPVLH